MSAIVLAKITHEHYPVTLDPSTEPDAMTLGQTIDKLLVEAAARGETIQDVTLHLEPDEWSRYRARAWGLPAPETSDRSRLKPGRFKPAA